MPSGAATSNTPRDSSQEISDSPARVLTDRVQQKPTEYQRLGGLLLSVDLPVVPRSVGPIMSIHWSCKTERC
jgi:hypothetical protein